MFKNIFNKKSIPNKPIIILRELANDDISKDKDVNSLRYSELYLKKPLQYKPEIDEIISVEYYFGTVKKIINRYDENIIEVYIRKHTARTSY